MILEQIRKDIDACIGQQFTEEVKSRMESCFESIYAYVKQGYPQCREVLQFAIGQFERVNDFSVALLLLNGINRIRGVDHLFLNASAPFLNYIKTEWEDEDMTGILDRLGPLIAGRNEIHIPKLAVADALSEHERKCMTSLIHDSIIRYGLQTIWEKDIIDLHFMYLSILYPICKKDGVMGLFFSLCYNIEDRLNTSGLPQDARDLGESLLVIGYQEDMEEYGYFGASRAYTAAHHPVAGLLYLNLALCFLNEKQQQIEQKLAFELLWQVLKIMREVNIAPIDDVVYLEKTFKKLNCNSYDKISFVHTAFTVRAFQRDKSVVGDVINFLDEERENIFRKLDHAAMPWLSLFGALHMIFPNMDFSGLYLYENAMKNAMEDKGNVLLDYYRDDIDLSSHLKELMAKLDQTRNNEDYAQDSSMAQIVAKKVIKHAVEKDNPSDFILAMRLRSDFTFVKPTIEIDSEYRAVEAVNIKGEDCGILYGEVEALKMLLQTEKSDTVMWIGKGMGHLYRMTLLDNLYKFDVLERLGQIKVDAIQNDTVSKLAFVDSIRKENQPVYYKSKDELRQEGDELKDRLKEASLSIPNVAARLIIIKDMTIASFPHQLLRDERTNSLVGEILPTANGISTEVIIKTNFKEQLSAHFSKAYWSPIESGEFTFEAVKGSISDILGHHQFSINDEAVPSCPIQAELNVVCAHGGSNISDTEWFYAADKPIVETGKIIGQGKLLILFVCHSGSISYKGYDNAIHTMVKRYIRMGYSSVVAPMWSLSTAIIPVWLETFMNFMEAGAYVIDAVYKANMSVKERFVSPSAWACLHLFGNPYLQVSGQPRLRLNE